MRSVVRENSNICGTALKELGFTNHVVGRYSYETVKEISLWLGHNSNTLRALGILNKKI
jgi:hypothetical protein